MAQESDEEDQFPIARKSNHKRNGKKQKSGLRYSALLLIILLLGILIYFKPDLPIAIMAVFTSSQTATIHKTPTVPIKITPISSNVPTRIIKTAIPPTATTIALSPFPIILPTLTTPALPAPTLIGGGETSPQIAFASDRVNNTLQIFLMNADGSNQTQITNLPEGACQPAWSPDGSRLAFISPCSTNNRKQDQYKGAQIYTMNVDGSNLHLLPIPPSPAGDFDPAWSPDGNKIAFTSLRTGISHIFLANLDDCQNNEVCQIQELSNTHYADKQPAWSPDGLQIAYIRQLYYNQVWIMSANGKTSEQFRGQSILYNDLWPTWSPDGNYLWLSQMTKNPSTPWLIRISVRERSTTQGNRVVPIGQDSSFPIAGVSISPDGQWMVFESWPDGSNHDIYRMDVAGNVTFRLTNDPGFDFGATWRPVSAH